MPSDANGVFSLTPGYLAVTGETIQASQHNPVLEDLAAAMSARMMRSGAAPMTGPLPVVDGSVSSPAIKFNSASSTGFYKTANGIGVSVGGAKVAEFSAGGISLYLGLLLPFTGLTAPALTVLPYGQTLLRSTYADLWAFAQAEIAGGNTFYNNGNGTTTFGIGDMRGRTTAGKDNMGGTAAGRLNSLSGMSPDGQTLGGTGGAQSVAITQSQLPAYSPIYRGSLQSVVVNSTANNVVQNTVGAAFLQLGGANVYSLNGFGTSSTLQSTGNFTSAGTIDPLGSGDAHSNVQPTLVCNYLLYAGA